MTAGCVSSTLEESEITSSGCDDDDSFVKRISSGVDKTTIPSVGDEILGILVPIQDENSSSEGGRTPIESHLLMSLSYVTIPLSDKNF
jgi:hypothetical protein